ncbi:hypothetical protein HPB51_010829 [Rhipicephalus microplus]|uniref:Transposable element n=1 Tax=Rhipicephalus microplus TaxID=6941 RepID=A0A9J6E0M8_RHIMP|nr:hypothetical protein HPB51_010829 [Rhipicephalus microplus]
MFIPLFHAWVQPVASFATRGAAPSFHLAKIVVESVLKLESYGATIIGVVSDGAGNNRSMWTHVGISGKLSQPVNKIPHPTLEEGRSLHFMCDVLHIVKCVRNHLLAHTYGKAGSDSVNFEQYKKLHETEENQQLKVIIEFLDMLNSTEEESVNNNTKLFASQMTTESLRVTLMSVIDIITWPHNKDVRYVLTAKLNQDPLERFFGVVRSFGGDEDHSTITHFGQIFRLLSLYTPLKMATKGNCTSEADPVLVSVKHSLSAKKLEALSRKEDHQRKLATVIGQIELQEDVDGDAL